MRFEIDTDSSPRIDDVREVSNYVDALLFGLDRLEALPLSLRLIREMHARLLQSGRGQTKDPGNFRTSQNWIGGTRPGNALFVPPPVPEMQAALSELERFIHDETTALPPLIKAGLIHVQFETIHPFLDGNGRLGRLLITLFLCIEGVMRQPLLYLSLYFKSHRADYYRLLQEVREHGTWEAWLEFFLDGVAETAEQAFQSATRIVELFKADRAAIAASNDRSGSVLRLHEIMQTKPILSAPAARDLTGLTMPTVNAAFEALQSLDIIIEVTARRRGRIYVYRGYLNILSEGVDPISTDDNA